MSLLPLQRGTPLYPFSLLFKHTAAHPRSSYLSILHRRAVFDTVVLATPAPQSHPLSNTLPINASPPQPSVSAFLSTLPPTSSSHATPAFRLSPTYGALPLTPTSAPSLRPAARYRAACSRSSRPVVTPITPKGCSLRTCLGSEPVWTIKTAAATANRELAGIHAHCTQMAHGCCHAIRHHHWHNASLRSPHAQIRLAILRVSDRLAPLLQTIIHVFVLSYGCFQSFTTLRVSTFFSFLALSRCPALWMSGIASVVTRRSTPVVA
ncbi:hypothetical protein C8R45DRAFT_938712 [Mycena sanguinolenta]|nr:hypothetical protein C8R45DRAFT_938712 [Mycena sanguinolenta]